jgi:hypothetical protein
MAGGVGVEYTSLELRQIGGDSRSPGSRGNRSLGPSPYPQFSDKKFTTTTTLVYNCNS